MSEYENAKIVNIRKGEKSKERDKNIYAELRTANGELLVGSTLPYILKVLQERLTAPE